MSDVLDELRDMEYEAIEELQALEAQVVQRMQAPFQQLVGKRLRARRAWHAYSDPGASGEVLRARFEERLGEYECCLDVRFDERWNVVTVPLRDVVEVL